MHNSGYDYGKWGIVLIAVGFFTIFLVSFIQPKKRQWREAGILEAFIIALFTEMYGFPLTIYLLSSIFGIEIPFLHIKGHLWASLFGLGDSWGAAICMIGSLVMGVGMVLVIMGWQKIYRSEQTLVTNGVYKYVRHPQYTGIILITGGMLIQWPTALTILMWPVLTFAYFRLAKREEKGLEQTFGEKYRQYKKEVSMFFPSLK